MEIHKRKISAKIVADSIDCRGNRITTFVLTYPRIIHAEMMTHRLFSRNAASSRAIPFNKMVKSIEEDPFIPIAWQKDHKGMQGVEYITEPEAKYAASQIWKHSMKSAIESAKKLNSEILVTKQLVNRLLEPFQWYTCLVTATEYDNFFELRCPQYQHQNGEIFKSWKDLVSDAFKSDASRDWVDGLENYNELQRIQCSESDAEIHIQVLAEAMWDAKNESTPNQLEAGEWHIPFGDRINNENSYLLEGMIVNNKIKISTARCARLSYMTFDGEVDYDKDIKLHDTLLESKHFSPFEHCCKCMSDEEYESFIKGKIEICEDQSIEIGSGIEGWCNNVKGFIPYRYMLENE